MTRNKEPEKAKFHGQNPLYVKFGNKGWGGGGGGNYVKDQWVWTGPPPPPPQSCKGSMGMDNPPTPPPIPGRTSPMIAVAQF